MIFLKSAKTGSRLFQVFPDRVKPCETCWDKATNFWIATGSGATLTSPACSWFGSEELVVAGCFSYLVIFIYIYIYYKHLLIVQTGHSLPVSFRRKAKWTWTVSSSTITSWEQPPINLRPSSGDKRVVLFIVDGLWFSLKPAVGWSWCFQVFAHLVHAFRQLFFFF